MDQSPAAQPAVRFRPGKKRKAYRQRIDQDDDDHTADASSSSAAAVAQSQAEEPSEASAARAQDGDDDEEARVTAALRLRNARRGRLNGVGYGSVAKQDDDNAGERALIPHGADGALDKDAMIEGVANRFTHQTGHVAHLNDKHMMEYIESRLSSRASETKPKDTPAPTDPGSTPPALSAPERSKNPSSGLGAMQGHLMEIDLGDAVRDYNVARTERVALLGGTAEDNDSNRKAKKPRLGRDGKPRRPRNRRDSDALERDKLVEEVLRENRLDVYEAPSQSASHSRRTEVDGAADDRLAEEFRQQFLEDVAQRQLKKKKPTNQPSKSDDILKGPKLGGSRNVRSAVRDLLLSNQKEGKGKK